MEFDGFVLEVPSGVDEETFLDIYNHAAERVKAFRAQLQREVRAKCPGTLLASTEDYPRLAIVHHPERSN